jgi:adenosine kinase
LTLFARLRAGFSPCPFTMSIAISGSLAFDTLLSFEGAFEDQILPERLNALSVSFLVPTMRREYGGCAGNIAYNLHLLGEKPLIVAALGMDGDDYFQRIASWGLDTTWVKRHASQHTAQATIMTDKASNQITAFHPGAMSLAHETAVPDATHASIGIVAPNGKQAMMDHAKQFASAGTPFVWDPGQGLPMFSGEELRAIVPQANWISVNDYEADMLVQRMDTSLAALSRMLQGLVITRGKDGCDVWVNGQMERITAFQATATADPTGCGDSFRAGLLYGLKRQWPLGKACKLGNQIGAIKVAHQGCQNHGLDLAHMLSRL